MARQYMNLSKLFKRKQTQNPAFYFDLFERLYLLEPKIFYWIKPFPDKSGRYILSHFRHQDFIKYNGLELVIIDKDLMTYHRLPGAKPNGNGYVTAGIHEISLKSMNDNELHYFQVEKTNQINLYLRSIKKSPTAGVTYQNLPRRTLDYVRFIPELCEIIISGLDWHYRELLSGRNTLKMSAEHGLQLIDDMKKLDPRFEMVVERIKGLMFQENSH